MVSRTAASSGFIGVEACGHEDCILTHWARSRPELARWTDEPASADGLRHFRQTIISGVERGTLTLMNCLIANARIFLCQ
jgi:hypothetical protein